MDQKNVFLRLFQDSCESKSAKKLYNVKIQETEKLQQKLQDDHKLMTLPLSANSQAFKIINSDNSERPKKKMYLPERQMSKIDYLTSYSHNAFPYKSNPLLKKYYVAHRKKSDLNESKFDINRMRATSSPKTAEWYMMESSRSPKEDSRSLMESSRREHQMRWREVREKLNNSKMGKFTPGKRRIEKIRMPRREMLTKLMSATINKWDVSGFTDPLSEMNLK